LAGRLETARAIADKGLEMEPGFRLRLFFEHMPKEIAEKLAKGGRMVGLLD
jgi:hypothetical protein